jgi:hypothetical protein
MFFYREVMSVYREEYLVLDVGALIVTTSLESFNPLKTKRIYFT